MAKKYLELGKILKRLLFDKGMKPVDLAREVNIPPPTIHRLVTGKSTRPYKSSLKPIADYFSISVDELVGEKPLINNQVSLTENKNIQKFNKSINIPIISWENLQQVSKMNIDLCDTTPFSGKISDHAFATILEDSSMEPLFSRKSLLIFDPERTPKDRSYVLAKLQGTQLPVFRQLIIDLDQKYLKPLNPDLNAFKMKLLQSHDSILGTLVEARQIYDEY